MNFKQWLMEIGKPEVTAKKYSSAVSGSISKWAKDANLIQNNLTDVDDIHKFIYVLDKIKKLQIFVERDTKGKRMYSAALNHYKSYLEDIFQEDCKNDIEEILDDSNIGKTQKSQLVNARLGQGKFRSYQINHWGCCALTEYSDTRFLIASHIKPWRNANINSAI